MCLFPAVEQLQCAWCRGQRCGQGGQMWAEVQAGLAALREPPGWAGPRTRHSRWCVTVTPWLSGVQEDPKCRHPLASCAPRGRLSLVLDVSDAEREPVPAHELRAGGSRRCWWQRWREDPQPWARWRRAALGGQGATGCLSAGGGEGVRDVPPGDLVSSPPLLLGCRSP